MACDETGAIGSEQHSRTDYHANGHYWYGEFLSIAGRHAEAIANRNVPGNLTRYRTSSIPGWDRGSSLPGNTISP